MPSPRSMGQGRRGAPAVGKDGRKPLADFSALGRAVKKLFAYYPRMAPLTMACILFSAIVSSIPSIFVQNIIAIIERWYKSGDWAAARPEVLRFVGILAVLYVLALISTTTYNQLMGGAAVAEAAGKTESPRYSALVRAGQNRITEYVKEHIGYFGTKPID